MQIQYYKKQVNEPVVQIRTTQGMQMNAENIR